ncbi:DUF4307 domain-containing protein [Streptomyces sp. HNM0575]|uniref:DUF4307 domain-containing protein n=1 Tax=Streptomyces sp. HNM0575 TaxID=2716338 RepID=UPI00145DD80A|nr:DUF4307 domain-containing protein [Streptomyces sp. HNM0575]NLU72218.1 DUF4307 domain-containing protein [Streptomyces sp. HNM0575]
MVDVRSADGERGAPAAGGPARGDLAQGRAVPEGRYGRSGGGPGRDARTDRRLKIVGLVLGVLSLAGIGWFGADYIGGQPVSAQVIKFEVVSGRTVEVHLEVRKDAEAKGVCTLRARAADGGEVGRKDVTVAGGSDQVDRVVSLRTTRRATSAELLGCEPRETEGH